MPPTSKECNWNRAAEGGAWKYTALEPLELLVTRGQDANKEARPYSKRRSSAPSEGGGTRATYSPIPTDFVRDNVAFKAKLVQLKASVSKSILLY